MARDGRPVLDAREASRIVQHGLIEALFQPIEQLQTGACRGFEALARLPHGGRLVAPDDFLPLLDADDRLCLFGTMLGHAIALLKRQRATAADFYVSLNVEKSLVAGEDFIDVLRYFLDRHDFGGERLVLEILENEDGRHDFERLYDRLVAIRALGLSVALDDIGSGYASLDNLKSLPVDIIKLDRSFSRNLEDKPDDLVFLMNVAALAQGLDCAMVAEGIETPEVYDALRILGIKYGQGYAIAKPMPAAALDAWLAARVLREPSLVPRCLLGAYASNLTVVESCRALLRQPLPMVWTADALDHCGCAIGRLFGPRGWHDTAFGRAHVAFHQSLPTFNVEEARFHQVTDAFKSTMVAALAAEPSVYRCEPVPATPRTRHGNIARVRSRRLKAVG